MVLTEMLHDGALPVSGFASDFLLDGARAGTHHQMVLDHLPWDPGKV